MNEMKSKVIGEWVTFFRFFSFMAYFPIFYELKRTLFDGI